MDTPEESLMKTKGEGWAAGTDREQAGVFWDKRDTMGQSGQSGQSPVLVAIEYRLAGAEAGVKIRRWRDAIDDKWFVYNRLGYPNIHFASGKGFGAWEAELFSTAEEAAEAYRRWEELNPWTGAKKR